MAKQLNVPSLQHLARCWQEDPLKIQKTLVQLYKSTPTFNYKPMYGAVTDLLVFDQPYEEVKKGIRDKVGREWLRDNYLEILSLIRKHFNGVSTDFVHSVDVRMYGVGKTLMVPFTPPLIYGSGGAIVFPWFSFWKSQPLAGKNLSLFVSLVDEVLLQDPDLEDARFEILDFSSPRPKEPRKLAVVDAEDIPRLDMGEVTEMLETFAIAFAAAQRQIEEAQRANDAEPQRPHDDRQRGLFD